MRAFLSHASEDKEDFVEPLARELAEMGVAPWLDIWEIRPGDSLVRKLFEEGLDAVDAVIVVVSSSSAAKPWVREELDAAVVRRIAELSAAAFQKGIDAVVPGAEAARRQVIVAWSTTHPTATARCTNWRC